MCNLFGGGSSPSQSTTPTYTPPAQTATTGPAAAGGAAPGVQVRGSKTDNRWGGTDTRSVRRSGGSGGQVDSTLAAKKRRSASAGLGL